MTFRCLFHVHTRCSFDSMMSPRAIIAKARNLGIYALIVTDHNTIQGALEVQAAARGNPPMVITAAEYQSEKGDIIGMFLKKEIRSTHSREIIQQIRVQDGLVVLPHPYKAHKLDDELLSGVDLIETHNSRCSPQENRQAQQLAMEWKLPTLVGADAHCSQELGSALNEFYAGPPVTALRFREYLLRAPRSFTVQPASPLCRPYSQMIKAFKTKNPQLFLYQVKRMAMALAAEVKQ